MALYRHPPPCPPPHPRRPHRRCLPQTQCTKCGFDGCRPYAEAIAAGTAEINQCPPGGAEGIARLSSVTGRKVIPLNPVNGLERPRAVAYIDESLCIGCTLCIQACPVDAIVGAAKLMHTVVPSLCTGCDLCVAPCPVDCIVMYPVTETTGWAAWTQADADAARERHDFRTMRLKRDKQENDARLAAKAEAKMAAAGHRSGRRSGPPRWNASAPSSPPPWNARASRKNKTNNERSQTLRNVRALPRRQPETRHRT
jgi:electron transport complex protein RnfB